MKPGNSLIRKRSNRMRMRLTQRVGAGLLVKANAVLVAGFLACVGCSGCMFLPSLRMLP